MRTTEQRRRRQRGTQVAELALIIPLLLLLIAIIIEGAGFVRVHQVLNNASREGARIASLPENAPSASAPDHTPDIKRAVAAYACNNGVALIGTGIPCGTPSPNVVCNAASITVNQSVLIPTASGLFVTGSRVVTTCSYQSQFLPSVPFFGISSTFPLTGTAEFQQTY
jgi:Flp pilus assembly protein TadG